MPVTSHLAALVTYVKYPNLDLITNILKSKKGREKRNIKTEWKISKLKADISSFVTN